ncbi:MAG: hypothetical protein JSW18_01825 [Candidatus Omnitrophota bacterium]|nr:MAG: hypothetical protein JSW18_01825 [Candidatus Omnitrophota bacterium]
MGKVLSVVGGIVAIIIGVILFFVWTRALVLGIQFSIMAILVFGGLIALIAGISEIKDSIAAKKEEKKEEKK